MRQSDLTDQSIMGSPASPASTTPPLLPPLPLSKSQVNWTNGKVASRFFRRSSSEVTVASLSPGSPRVDACTSGKPPSPPPSVGGATNLPSPGAEVLPHARGVSSARCNKGNSVCNRQKQDNLCIGGFQGHQCEPIDEHNSTVWEVLEPYGATECLDAVRCVSASSSVHVGLWSTSALSCGMPLPIGLSFIDSHVARRMTCHQLIQLRDKYLTELRSRLPHWLRLLQEDEGWKYHGTKEGTVFHRREPKGEAPLIRGRMNMGGELSMQDYNDINMDRDFYPNLYGSSRTLKHFKPALTWAGSLEQPWFLNFSWLCYNGFPPIVADREVLTASLVVFIDKHQTVTVTMSANDEPISFPEKPPNAVPLSLGAVFETRQLSDNSVECSGAVQARMKLLVPQFLYIRSNLFTQPVDWTVVKEYTHSRKGRNSIGKHPVSDLIKTVEGINGRKLWLEENPTFNPWTDLKSITHEQLCEYAWNKKYVDVGGSGVGCVQTLGRRVVR